MDLKEYRKALEGLGMRDEIAKPAFEIIDKAIERGSLYEAEKKHLLELVNFEASVLDFEANMNGNLAEICEEFFDGLEETAEKNDVDMAVYAKIAKEEQNNKAE